MKKTRLNGYFYDSRVDYDAIAVDDIPNIHKYLMKMKGIVENAWICRENICSSNDAFWL